MNARTFSPPASMMLVALAGACAVSCANGRNAGGASGVASSTLGSGPAPTKSACRREPAVAEGFVQEAPVKSVVVDSGAAATASQTAAVAAPSSPTLSDPCEAQLEAARADLLQRGFAPVRDPARWLWVKRHDDVLSLSLDMRTSADGAATWFRASLNARVGRASPWRRKLAPYCCDEHANPEDNLRELSWKRHSATAQASISIVYFAEATQPEDLRDRTLFVEVAKRALDACLTARVP
jgi:hypothetical protein